MTTLAEVSMLNATMRPSRETSGPKCGPSSNVSWRLAAVRRNLEQLDLAVAHRAEHHRAAIAGERATDAGMIGGQRSSSPRGRSRTRR